MAVIEDKATYVPNGPARKITAAQWRKIHADRARELPEVKARYAALASAIKTAKTTFIIHTMDYGLVIGTNEKRLEVVVYSPEDTFGVSGIREWQVYYGDAAWGWQTTETFPEDMSAEDIAYRVDFLVNIVNAYTKALRSKYTRRMKAITDRMTTHVDGFIGPEDKARYVKELSASKVTRRVR